MILISIQPFAPKKLFALGATIACLSTASCFADAMYLSSKSQSFERKAPNIEASEQAARSVTADTSAAMLVGPSGARLA